MFEAIASVLQLIVQPCYQLTGNWWVAILLFTLITKVILLPMSLWCQKNAIVMVQLMPDLNRLKVKYFGDRETIGEKQNELYKEKHYHPMLSLVPLAIQILILFGLVDVIHSITDYGAPGTELLGLVPVEDGGIAWVWPVFAGASAVLMGFAQNRINPLQREQSRAEKNMTNGLSIGLSLVLALFVAAGMAFYWVCSNLSSILIQAICNIVIRPSKYIDYEDLEASRVELAALNSLEGERKKKWYQRDPLTKREKADYKRFFNVIDKHIVFYSEGSGFYRYFSGAIKYIINHSTAHIHYVTNDPNDQIFGIARKNPRIHPYYIGQKRSITLMMKMDADVMVSTLEDLDNYYIKRSYVRKDIEYVFMPHAMMSTHLTATKGAFEHYDTFLCVGPHQVRELRRAEELYGQKRKNLVECGYDLLDEEIRGFERMQMTEADQPASRPSILIAPSWQEDNILDSCIDDMLRSLLGRGWRVIVRPHPEYTKRYRARWESLQARYARVPESELYFERDFSSSDSIQRSSVMITDWSSIACEFAFTTLRPCIFVNTPMKVCNPDWQELGIQPTDITLRDQVGVSFAPSQAGQIGATVADMLEHSGEWQDRIEKVCSDHVFNLGSGAMVAGEYILQAAMKKQAEKQADGRAAAPVASGKSRERKPAAKRGRVNGGASSKRPSARSASAGSPACRSASARTASRRAASERTTTERAATNRRPSSRSVSSRQSSGRTSANRRPSSQTAGNRPSANSASTRSNRRR